MDRHWPPTDHSTSGFATLPTSSPEPVSGEPGWTGFRDEITRALARLEMGQILNRKTVDMRVTDLRHHVDGRISDLRAEMRQRIERVEDHMVASRATQQDSPQTESPPPQSPPVPPTEWWREMSLREALTWALVFCGALGWIQIEIVERLIKAIGAALLGLK